MKNQNPFTFGANTLQTKNSRAWRRFSTKGRDTARFYYTYDGELRARLEGVTYAWMCQGKDSRNRQKFCWKQILMG